MLVHGKEAARYNSPRTGVTAAALMVVSAWEIEEATTTKISCDVP